MSRRSDTVAAVDPAALQQEALDAVASAASLDALDELRVRYLGRKSELKQALRNVRSRESGMALNTAREAIEQAIDSKHAELERAALDRALTQDRVDVTIPSELLEGGRVSLPTRGQLHLLTQMRREIEDVFLGLGYAVFDGPEVEDAYHNFDALNTP